MSAMALSSPGMLSGVRDDAPDAMSRRLSMRNALAAGIDLDVRILAVQFTADVLSQNIPRCFALSVGWSYSRMRYPMTRLMSSRPFMKRSPSGLDGDLMRAFMSSGQAYCHTSGSRLSRPD
eukprot:6880489-Ditylum_brightwellii.AAC.1